MTDDEKQAAIHSEDPPEPCPELVEGFIEGQRRTIDRLQAEKADLIQALYTAEQALRTALVDFPTLTFLEWPLKVVRMALARVGETEWNEAGGQ